MAKGEGNLTFVKGNRENLDPVSKRILSVGKGRLSKAKSLPDAKDGTLIIDQYRGKKDCGHNVSASGTSIFDPVLCEIAYRWFCPPGGSILDPFAGGSVRGIVASMIGLKYTGIDLSERQIEANRAQAETICKGQPYQPTWIVGDSQDIKTLAPGEYDLVFSCPPYADLEVYSEDPKDLSTMIYEDFITAYRAIIAGCVSMLKQDRFAVFVVGDVRDKRGFYRNFPAHTIDAFQDAGMILYNQAVLITAVGSLPIRVGRQFEKGRKLGKTHQDVMAFFQGDPVEIKKNIDKDFMQNRNLAKVHDNVPVFFQGDPKTIKQNYPDIDVDEDAMNGIFDNVIFDGATTDGKRSQKHPQQDNRA